MGLHLLAVGKTAKLLLLLFYFIFFSSPPALVAILPCKFKERKHVILGLCLPWELENLGPRLHEACYCNAAFFVHP